MRGGENGEEFLIDGSRGWAASFPSRSPQSMDRTGLKGWCWEAWVIVGMGVAMVKAILAQSAGGLEWEPLRRLVLWFLVL